MLGNSSWVDLGHVGCIVGGGTTFFKSWLVMENGTGWPGFISQRDRLLIRLSFGLSRFCFVLWFLGLWFLGFLGIECWKFSVWFGWLGLGLKWVSCWRESGSRNFSHDLKKSIGTFDLTSNDLSIESSSDWWFEGNVQFNPRVDPFDLSSDFPLNLFATWFLRFFQFWAQFRFLA